MGDVIAFRKTRLAGFLPDDLGGLESQRRAEAERDLESLRSLFGFAKSGAPPIIPPDDCA